jgi:hypothetical protein
MLNVMVVLVTNGPPRELGPRKSPSLPRIGDRFTMAADGSGQAYRVETVDKATHPVNVYVVPA